MEHAVHFDWQFLALWVGVPLVVLGFVVAILLTGRRSRTTDRSRLTRAEELVVAMVGTGALLVGGITVAGLIFGGIRTFTENPWRILNMPIANAGVPEFTGKSDAITNAGYESVWLDVADIPTGSRWLFYLELALPALATIAISASIMWLAIALLRGRPFTVALTNTIGVASISVLIGGVGAQVAGAAARGSIVDFLGAQEITAGDIGAGPYEGLVGFMLNLDAAPVGWAFGLALVAGAFQIGTRLQRETDLLV